MRRIWRTGAHRDRGIGTVELLGIVALAAVLVTGAVLGARAYEPELRAAICRLTAAIEGGSGAACGTQGPPVAQEPTDDDFRPPVCMLHEESEKYSSEVKVWFFTFGQESGFIVQEFADGSVRVTVTDGAGIGASGALTSKTFDAGKLGDGDNAGLDIDLGGGVKFSYGDTWEFESQEQWQEMKGALDDYLVQEAMIRHNPEGGIWAAKAMGWKDPPKDPKVGFSRVELEVGLDVGLGLKDPTGTFDDKGDPEFFDPNVGIGLSASAGTAVIIETDYETGERSFTYELTGQGSAEGNLVVGSIEAQGMTQGAFTVTRDKDGKVTELVFNSVREGGVSGSLGNDSFDVGGGAGREDSTSTVTTTRLTVDASNRAMVDQWLSERNDYGVALALPFQAMVPDRPSDDPFLQHMYEKATTSVIQYHNVRDKWEFEAAVKKGWEFGFSISGEEATADAVTSDFLGAPGRDGVRPMVPDTECVS